MVQGAQLREKRMELNLKQQDVARFMGITQQMYSKIETSKWVTKKYSGLIHQLEEMKFNPATRCSVLGAYSCECGMNIFH